MSRMNLPQVHQLVHDAVDAEAVAVHQVVGILADGVLLGLPDGPQRAHHEVQRGADLVGEVGEQAEPQLLQLGFLLLLILAQPLAGQMHQRQDDSGEDEQVHGPGPSGQEPGSFDAEVNAALGKDFGRAGKVCLDLEAVTTRPHIGIGSHAQARGGRFPVAFEAREPIVEHEALRIGVFRNGEFQREHVHPAWDPDSGCL